MIQHRSVILQQMMTKSGTICMFQYLGQVKAVERPEQIAERQALAS